jgi:hypothetical protein
MSDQSQKAGRRPRPSETVLERLGARDRPGSIEQHLKGCLAAYRHFQGQKGNYGAAVHFALEAIWGIGRYHRNLAAEGTIPERERDADFGLNPTHMVDVPWIWIFALSEAWDRYDKQGEPFERAFGLAGSQGKRPTRSIVNRVIDEYAVAIDVWARVQKARSAGQKLTILEAAALQLSHPASPTLQSASIRVSALSYESQKSAARRPCPVSGCTTGSRLEGR